MRDFLDALERAAAGWTARDPEVAASSAAPAGIAQRLVISESAVEKHVSSVFAKLRLEPAETDHRRVLAVPRYLEGG